MWIVVGYATRRSSRIEVYVLCCIAEMLMYVYHHHHHQICNVLRVVLNRRNLAKKMTER